MRTGSNYSGPRWAFATKRRQLIVRRPKVGDVLTVESEETEARRDLVTVEAVHRGGQSLTVRGQDGVQRVVGRAPDGFWTRTPDPST